jgi:segregation and condensation protein B
MSQPAPEIIIEAALLAAGEPLSMEQLRALFSDETPPPVGEIEQALQRLDQSLAHRGIELKHLASGYRLQVPEALAPWVSRLWEEKPARYSRALLLPLAVTLCARCRSAVGFGLRVIAMRRADRQCLQPLALFSITLIWRA